MPSVFERRYCPTRTGAVVDAEAACILREDADESACGGQRWNPAALAQRRRASGSGAMEKQQVRSSAVESIKRGGVRSRQPRARRSAAERGSGSR
jgi:hypothetical protein